MAIEIAAISTIIGIIKDLVNAISALWKWLRREKQMGMCGGLIPGTQYLIRRPRKKTNGDGAQYFRSSSFIYYTVNRSLKAITQYASGSTFKEVSGTVLKTVNVCLPASDVVERFANKVDSIFKHQNVLEQENQQLTQLRDWLLPMLMNGQVTVT